MAADGPNWLPEPTTTTREGAAAWSRGRSFSVSRKWPRWLTAKVDSSPSSEALYLLKIARRPKVEAARRRSKSVPPADALRREVEDSSVQHQRSERRPAVGRVLLREAARTLRHARERAEVARDERDFGVPIQLVPVQHGLHPLLASGSKHEAAPKRGEGHGGGLADARCGPGDEHGALEHVRRGNLAEDVRRAGAPAERHGAGARAMQMNEAESKVLGFPPPTNRNIACESVRGNPQTEPSVCYLYQYSYNVLVVISSNVSTRSVQYSMASALLAL